MNTVVKIEPKDIDAIPFQEASLDIWDKKYRLTAKDGDAHRQDDGRHLQARRARAGRRRARRSCASTGTSASCGRCAAARSRPAASPPTPARWSTSRPPRRSTAPSRAPSATRWTTSWSKVHEAGLTLKAGCGIGYEFSTLRPRGAYVSGAGAYTSGPLSFMDIYDKMCFTVSSAGGRRGAQMGTFDVGHPDAKEFIRAKREDGRLRQFNLSLLITDEFMQAVRERPRLAAGLPAARSRNTRTSIRSRPTPRSSSGASGRRTRTTSSNDDGLVACKIYKPHPRAAPVGRDHGLDLRLRRAGLHPHRPRQRDEQQLVVREHPRHQPLRRAAAAAVRLVPARLGEPDHASCAIRSPTGATSTGTNTARWCRCSRACSTTWSRSTACRCEQQRDEIMRKRRHGMGFLGLGSTHDAAEA